MENESSNRRKFLRRLAGLTAVGGIAGLLTGHLSAKEMTPPVQAANGDPLIIGALNSGGSPSTTTLDGNLTSPVLEVLNDNTSAPGTAIRSITEYETSPTHEVPLAGIHGVAKNGTGVQGESMSGWGLRGISNSRHNTQFKNRGGATDKSTLIQLETGDAVPQTWNMGVGGAGNGIGLTDGQFYIERSGPAKSARPLVIDTNGNVGVGTNTPARSVHLSGGNACFRMDRNADSAAFILVRTAAGNFNTIWKTFYVGVDAVGVNNGEFFIGDVGTNVTGPSAKRLWIDNSGGVHIPNLVSGDMNFANGVKATEEGDGLAFLNAKGNKIAVLDSEGNFRVKGKITEDPTL